MDGTALIQRRLLSLVWMGLENLPSCNISSSFEAELRSPESHTRTTPVSWSA